jgi:hypothetical protein
MKTGRLLFPLALAILIGFLPSPSALRADDTPATQPAGPDAKRFTFLGDQLSADEAAIKEIDHRLVMAGYQQAQAAEKADNYAKGNDLMDRNGGAPVHWQDFYGRTAKDFIVRDTLTAGIAANRTGGRNGNLALNGQVQAESGAYQLQRPAEFDYVYRANDQQIADARAEIAEMGNQVDKLLARRRELEVEQSSLWATIAFESIENRDIPDRALYRDQLKAAGAAGNDNRPDPARVAALGAAVLYLKTVDHTVTTLADQLDADQESAYASLRATLEKAEESLRQAAATFADTPGVDPAETAQMADVVSDAKGIQSLCKDLCDAYHKALDADAAQEEGRKLLYRRTMQDSLFTLAESVAALDDKLVQMSAAWNIAPLAATPSNDPVIAVVEVTVPQAPAAVVAPQVVASPTPAAEASIQQPIQAAPQPNPPPLPDSHVAGGTLSVLFGSGTMSIYLNGQKVDSSQGVALRTIPLTLHAGDFLVIRASSPSAYRVIRFAYGGNANAGSFVSKPATAVIRQVDDPAAPVPAQSFDGSAPTSARPTSEAESLWTDANLPANARWIHLPSRNTVYDIGFTVPNAAAAAPNPPPR